MKSRPSLKTLKLVLLFLASQSAMAANFSFTGTFRSDTDVQFFNFSLAADSTDAVINTLSLNGGTNLASNLIAGGGFNPYLAIFDASTGDFKFDTSSKAGGDEAVISNTAPYFYGTLLAGNYILALTQFDNVVAGTNLSDGFANDLSLYTPPGTPFNGLTGNWAVDMSFVDSASMDASVPAPDTYSLLLVGLVGFVATLRSKRQTA